MLLHIKRFKKSITKDWSFKTPIIFNNKTKHPTPKEIIKILEHLCEMWKHDTEIKYVLDRYKELEEDLM